MRKKNVRTKTGPKRPQHQTGSASGGLKASALKERRSKPKAVQNKAVQNTRVGGKGDTNVTLTFRSQGLRPFTDTRVLNADQCANLRKHFGVQHASALKLRSYYYDSDHDGRQLCIYEVSSGRRLFFKADRIDGSVPPIMPLVESLAGMADTGPDVETKVQLTLQCANEYQSHCVVRDCVTIAQFHNLCRYFGVPDEDETSKGKTSLELCYAREGGVEDTWHIYNKSQGTSGKILVIKQGRQTINNMVRAEVRNTANSKEVCIEMPGKSRHVVHMAEDRVAALESSGLISTLGGCKTIKVAPPYPSAFNRQGKRLWNIGMMGDGSVKVTIQTCEPEGASAVYAPTPEDICRAIERYDPTQGFDSGRRSPPRRAGSPAQGAERLSPHGLGLVLTEVGGRKFVVPGPDSDSGKGNPFDLLR